MKILVKEAEAEGLEGLLGQRVTFFGAVYIYTGLLAGVNDTQVKLEEASIVYETGAFDAATWKDAQRLPNPVYIRLLAVECYTVIR